MNPTTLTQHYLAVQALTPQSGAPVIQQSATVTQNLPFGLPLISLLIVGGLIIGGIIILLFATVRDLSQIVKILGLVLMVGAVPISVTIMNQQTRIESQAGPDYVPKNVIVTQVSQESFAVLWDTDRPGTGVLRLRTMTAPSEFNTIVSETEGGEIYKHLVKVTNLKPGTNYYFEILSGGVWYDDRGKPLQVNTLP